MNRAFVSGQAGAAFERVEPPIVWAVGSDEPANSTHQQIAHAISGVTDLELISFKTKIELKEKLKRAWSQDRALRLFILCLDTESDGDDLLECVAALDDLLIADGSDTRIRREFLARPLPRTVRQTLPGTTRCGALLQEIQDNQTHVERTFEIISSLPTSLFEDEATHSEAGELLVRLGIARLLTECLAQSKTAEAIQFDLLLALGKVPEGRKIAAHIASRIRGGAAQRSKFQVEPEVEADEDELGDFSGGSGNYDAYLNTRNQQKGIITKLREGNLKVADEYTQELVRNQQTNSSSEQIAKTLCLLSQEAKKLGFQSLQLQWARQATAFAPSDPVALGHEADALIGLAEYSQADIALDRTEAAGHARYAAIGRGRILRITGQFAEALAKFEAAKLLPTPPGDGEYIPQVMVAEVLQDMGRFHDAIAEYEAVIKSFPNVPLLVCGLASIQMEMGDFEAADANFSAAEALSVKNPESRKVARNGRASLRKKFGHLDAAHKMYDDIIRAFPNDPVAYCGKADVLKLKGDLRGAIRAYDEVIARFPGIHVPYGGKGDVLLELGENSQADRAFSLGAAKFPQLGDFALGTARAKLALGDYRDAHRLFEIARRRFPRSHEAKLGVANALKRLRQFREALSLYDHLLQLPGLAAKAAIGKASVLICLERYEEAISCLPTAYQTEDEWAGYFLKGVAYLRHVSPAAALEHFERAQAVPFARVRSLIKSMTARIRLEQDRPADAALVADKATTGTGQVIYLHALAASHQKVEAKRVLRQIQNSARPREQKELARSVAAVFSITNAKTSKTVKDLLLEEQIHLVLEAA